MKKITEVKIGNKYYQKSIQMFCRACGVDFKIEVEPDLKLEGIDTGDLIWLYRAKICPVCGKKSIEWD